MLFYGFMIENEDVFSVSELTLHIKNLLENQVGELYVEGEISNYVKPNSGHIYFSLKDDKALIKCVYFAGYNRFFKIALKNGDRVIVFGKLSVYERDGQYQLVVSKVIPSGVGALQIEFEKLKKKLNEEGLFDNKFKKVLPKFPKRIGIITSETGAAIQDILNVLNRRYPVEVLLYPCIVQGKEAPSTLIAGIKYFNNCNLSVDVIIIGRGGGSYEDLFCFNDELLAREIYACNIPIVSAVGHEIDFTISDFVADVRAATPSVAAELVVPDKNELLQELHRKKQTLDILLSKNIQGYANIILRYEKRLKELNPLNLIYRYQQYVDNYTIKISRFLGRFQDIKKRYQNLAYTFLKLHPSFVIDKKKHKIKLECNNLKYAFNNAYRFEALIIKRNEYLISNFMHKYNKITESYQYKLLTNQRQLDYLMSNKLDILTKTLEQKQLLLDSLSPKNILAKGFSIIEKDNILNRNIVKSIKQINKDDKIIINLKDGKCSAVIKD